MKSISKFASLCTYIVALYSVHVSNFSEESRVTHRAQADREI